MKIDLAKISYDGEWFDFKDGRVKVRPFPRSRSKFKMIEGALIFSGAETLEQFLYCLQEWEGFTDTEGKAMKLTDAVKTKVFDSGIMGLADFVIAKNVELQRRIAEEEKN